MTKEWSNNTEAKSLKNKSQQINKRTFISLYFKFKRKHIWWFKRKP